MHVQRLLFNMLRYFSHHNPTENVTFFCSLSFRLLLSKSDSYTTTIAVTIH